MRSTLDNLLERRPGPAVPLGGHAVAARVSGTSRRVDVLEIAGMLLIGHAYHLYYNLVGHLASLRGVDFGPLLITPLDRALPYLPGLVWFYQLAYVVPGIILVQLLWRLGPDVLALRRIFAGLVVLLSVHFALYLLLPMSAQSVRLAPDALGQGLSAELVRYQYRLATVWCAWPSLHVSGCWYLYRVIARHSPVLRWAWLAWFVGMLVGTAGIKIHYVLDGVAGLAVAEAVYRGVLLRLERTGACAWTWVVLARRAGPRARLHPADPAPPPAAAHARDGLRRSALSPLALREPRRISSPGCGPRDGVRLEVGRPAG